MIPRWTSTK